MARDDHRDHRQRRARSCTAPLPPDDPKVRRPDITLAHRVLDGWEPKVSVEDGPARAPATTSCEALAQERAGARVTDPRRIRNFCIIAHIDHGKSTLADRLLDATESLTARETRATSSSTRWISSASAASRSRPRPRACADRARDGQRLRPQPDRHARPRRLLLRGLARARRPARARVLVVDAAQGIEAQTLANAYLAVDAGLEIVPGRATRSTCPSADPRARGAGDRGRDRPRRRRRAAGLREGGHGHRRSCSSASSSACRRRRAIPTAPPRALVFDAWFDPYVGVGACSCASSTAASRKRRAHPADGARAASTSRRARRDRPAPAQRRGARRRARWAS